MNKIKFGLKNVHYSVITLANNVPSYATPVAVPGAVNLNLSPVGEKVEFYADDLLYYGTNANQGYEGDLEIALIPDTFRVDVMGETTDANGAIVENSEVTPKNFALMFEFNGDVAGTRHVLYNVNAARPNVEGATKTKTIEPKTEKLSITASPAVDTYNVKASLPYSTGASYTNFFGSVYLEDAVVNTITPATQSFSKGSPLDITLNSTSSGAAVVKNVLMAGAPIAGTNLSVTGADVVVDKTYLGTLTNGVYTVTVEFTLGNSVTMALTIGA